MEALIICTIAILLAACAVGWFLVLVVNEKYRELSQIARRQLQDIESTREARDEAEDKKDLAEGDFHRAEETIARLEDSLAHAKTQLGNALERVTQYRTDCTKTACMLEDLRTEHATIEADLKVDLLRARNDIQGMNAAIEQYRDAIHTEEAGHKATLLALTTARHEIDELTAERDSLRLEALDCRQKAADYRKGMEVANAYKDSLIDQIAVLTGKLDAIRGLAVPEASVADFALTPSLTPWHDKVVGKVCEAEANGWHEVVA